MKQDTEMPLNHLFVKYIYSGVFVCLDDSSRDPAEMRGVLRDPGVGK